MISVDSIESFSVHDGPGIRTVVFLNECKLRCIYCHNPEMWCKGKLLDNDKLAQRIVCNKEYFGENGGVTFSGGEPLLQAKELVDVIKKLKKENIHVALDTAGVGNGDYEELLSLVDLIIFDVKHTTREGYQKITRVDTEESLNFLRVANSLNKKFWIRQVIVPGIMDNHEYLVSLKEYLKQVKNILKIEFLPYHKLGREKYLALNIPYPCEDILEMDPIKCQELYDEFMKLMQSD